MYRPSLCFTEIWEDGVVSRCVFSRRIGCSILEISIVRVLGQEVLGIGAHISRGLVARRLSTRTCCGNGQTNV